MGEQKTRARLVIYRDCVLPFPNLLHRIVLYCRRNIFHLFLFFGMFAQSLFPFFCVFLSLAYYLLEISLSDCNSNALHSHSLAFTVFSLFLSLYVKFAIFANRNNKTTIRVYDIANEIETIGKYQCT